MNIFKKQINDDWLWAVLIAVIFMVGLSDAAVLHWIEGHLVILAAVLASALLSGAISGYLWHRVGFVKGRSAGYVLGCKHTFTIDQRSVDE